VGEGELGELGEGLGDGDGGGGGMGSASAGLGRDMLVPRLRAREEKRPSFGILDCTSMLWSSSKGSRGTRAAALSSTALAWKGR
jgi:hypothetical protein